MILTISNQKGGVGKTTLAFNLAHAFQGRRLIIDLDPSGSLTYLLNVDRPLHCSDHLFFEDDKGNLPQWSDIAIQPYDNKDIYVIPSQITGYDVDLHSNPENRMKLINTFEKAIKTFDGTVIIDCEGNKSTVSIAALYASDLILVPVALEEASIVNLADHLNFINEWIPDGEYLIVPNMYEKVRKAPSIILEQLNDTFINRITPAIPRNIAITEVFVHKKPALEIMKSTLDKIISWQQQ